MISAASARDDAATRGRSVKWRHARAPLGKGWFDPSRPLYALGTTLQRGVMTASSAILVRGRFAL